MSPRMAKTIDVVTSETQLATNSFPLCINPPGGAWPRKLNTNYSGVLQEGRIGDIPFPAMPAAPRWRGAPSFVRLLSWAAIAWIVVFWRLGFPSLMDPDEAHYAELTREMIRAGNWLVPLLDGQPYIDKPILFHWLQGAAMTLLGETEFAARLPSALAALALFWTTRRAGIAMFGEQVGEWGALMFATIPATFALASIGLFDMIFTAFLFGALTCLMAASSSGGAVSADAVPDRRREIAGYALLSFAVMIK